MTRERPFSRRIYALAELFTKSAYMRFDEAQTQDQRPFRALLIRGWIAYTPGRGFHMTREGRDAWSNLHTTDITRKNPSLPLTAYFDATAYGLDKPARRVHVMTKRGAA